MRLSLLAPTMFPPACAAVFSRRGKGVRPTPGQPAIHVTHIHLRRTLGSRLKRHSFSFRLAF